MKKLIVAGSTLLLPTFAFAQAPVTDLTSLGEAIQYVMNLAFPILLGIAVIVIIWGVFQMILNAGDEEARKAGRTKLLWGVIGVFLMLSVWGLINILVNSFDFGTGPTDTFVVPNVNPGVTGS